MKIDSLYPIFANAWARPKTNNIWLYSDPHFGDPEMVHIRKDYIGDAEQVKRINSKVGKYDTLIILGDVGDPSFVAQLHGYKVLIMGNHDKGASNYQACISQKSALFAMPQNKPIPYTAAEYQESEAVRMAVQEYYPGLTHVEERIVEQNNHLFDEVYEGVLVIGPKLILSHQPISDLPPFLFNIHGHDHSGWFGEDKNHLNLCAEMIGYTPVSLTSIIKSGKLADITSIHRLQIDRTVAKKNKH